MSMKEMLLKNRFFHFHLNSRIMRQVLYSYTITTDFKNFKKKKKLKRENMQSSLSLVLIVLVC